jgi:uncharacterized DUF497 family protein
MKFDWFRLKAESNFKKHGVNFEELQPHLMTRFKQL